VRNIRLTVEYEGTGFSGYQFQPEDPTVQGELERALVELTGAPHRVQASGRTDAGVHALAQVVNFHTESDLPLKAFLHGVNAFLPEAIRVKSVAEMPLDFDSRRSAVRKTYLYRIYADHAPPVLMRAFTWWIYNNLDIEEMRRGASHLVGIHDFAGFRSAGCDSLTTIREITAVRVSREGNLISIEVTGSGFLRNMVRIIVGTLVEIGQGRRKAESVSELLKDCDRGKAGITAPPQGLLLKEVFYGDEPLEVYP